MQIGDPVVVAQIVGFGVFLWLGLYMLVRARRLSVSIVVALVALFSQAAFFATSALTYTAPDVVTLARLERWSWWTAVLPTAAWFHFSSLIARQMLGAQRRDLRAWTPSIIIVYVSAGLLSVFGSISNLVLNYGAPIGSVGQYEAIGPGPAYPLYIVYLALTAVGAIVNLGRAFRYASRSVEPSDQALSQQLRLLLIGAVLFLLGALWISSRYNWALSASVLPGYLCLFAGLAGLGFGIAQFGMLLDGQEIRRDFVYNLTGIGLMNVLYVGLLVASGLFSVVSVLALVGLVTLTHTTFDAGRALLDKLFFTPAEQAARAEARDYANVLATDPVTPPAALSRPTVDETPVEQSDAITFDAEPITTEKAFRDQVRKAITGLKSPPQLAKSPLLALRLVEQRVVVTSQADNRLNRAAALRDILIEQIEALRPKDDVSSKTGEAWRFYNVLYYPYIRAVSRKGALREARQLAEERRRSGQRVPSDLEAVLSWLADVDEDTFYKWQRRASDTIALILWEEDQKLQQPAAAVSAEREMVPGKVG